MPLNISISKLLAWNDASARNWHAFITANPAIFTLPCDIHKSTTIADTLQHIVAAELRYAQRLAALPESPYEAVPKDSIDSILSTHNEALTITNTLLADPTYDWQQELTFNTITVGRVTATREAIAIHFPTHSIRHYAQLATLVRQHGFTPNWPMDYLMMDAHHA